MKPHSFFTILLAILLHNFEPLLAQSNDEPIYAEPFLLTQQMLARHARLVQLLLDVRYNEAQLQKHFSLVKAYWQKKDHKGMQAVMGNLQFYEEIVSKTPEEQKAFVRQIRSTLIISLIDDSKKAEDSKWYLQNYYAAHPPLLQADIPLVKETADDLIDFEFFKNRTLKGLAVKAITPLQRDSAYAQLAAAWKTFSAAKKKEIMIGASRLALIQYGWKNLGSLDKIDLKLRYVGRKYVSDAEYRQYQQALAKLSSGNRSSQWQLVQNELDFMKKSTDIIMSRGTRWNPAANRYEQEGGVVTEYW
jgi:hypothetical protein